MRRHSRIIYLYRRPNSFFVVRMSGVVRHVNKDGTYTIDAQKVLDTRGKPVGPDMRMRLRVTAEQIMAA